MKTITTQPASNELDTRETLYNEPRNGPAHEIQMPLERITSVRGLLFDIDPRLYRADNPLFPPADDLRTFLAQIEPVLNRHPLARHAEVRNSGTGLHAIVWLEPAIQLKSAAEQNYWDAIVKAVQRTLPVDPDMPGLTALTRLVGSINNKNGAKVEVLQPGQPVDPREIVEFINRLMKAPFKEFAIILLGQERIRPCPVCQGEGTRLDVLDYVGMCYGGCGKVKGNDLLDAIYQPLMISSERSNQRSSTAKKPKSPKGHRQGGKKKAGKGHGKDPD
jgi:hypothetical protein